jgi:AraC-like DNA-binding protein
MDPIFFHIVKSGANKSIDFIAQASTHANKNLNPNFCQSFMASGSFGTAHYDQFDVPKARLQNIRLDIKEEIEICFRADFEHISMMYCNSGSLQLRRSEFPMVLVAQSQISTIHSQNGEKYTVSIKPKEIRPCVLVHICIPFPADSSGNQTPINKIRKYFQQFSNISDEILVFSSTIDSQKSYFTLREELGKENPDFHLVQAYIDILLLETLRQFELSRLGENGRDYWDPEIRAVYAMAEMIILGMDESWTIKKFASIQHLNPNKLKILFKNHIGMPAAAFRISVRMQKATQLLRETKLSIQEISALVGYTNPAQFSTMFKRKIGCTPNQVRKE